MRKTSIALILLATSGLSIADPVAERLKNTLPSSLPGLRIDSVTPTPVPGVYQMVSGQDIAYVSADGKYMFQGILFDVEKRKNLTEDGKNAPRAEILKSLKSTMIISFKPQGKTLETITVFTDPSCPYCRKLHDEVPKLTQMGVEVRYVTFPREGVSSETGRAIEAAFCSKSPKESINKLMKGESSSEMMPCVGNSGKDAIAYFSKVATEIGAHGTPYIVSSNGKAIPGYRPAEEIMKALKN